MLAPPLHFHHERCKWRWDRESLLQPPQHCQSATFSPCWSLLLPSSCGAASDSAPLQGLVDWVLPGKFCSEISSSIGSGIFGCRAGSFQLELSAGLNGRGFFLSGYPVACFHGWQQLILVIFGLSARPGTTWTLWQLNTLSAGGNICKDLILCTLAAFSKEHWNIFPWAQEIVSTQTFHAVPGE